MRTATSSRKNISKGNVAEEIIAREYLARGFLLVGRNVKIFGYKQLGEIDLIFEKGDLLVFVEVKARRDELFMPVAEAIGPAKRRRLLRAVKAYLFRHPGLAGKYCRVDAGLVVGHLDSPNRRVNIIKDVIQDLS